MTVHVVGAGLAGLAAACVLSESGRHVILYDSAKHAGGRARSYFDKELGCRIDNGNHLILSGNTATSVYLRRIGARDALAGPAKPIFPFHDVASGESWTLRLNHGPIPWWVFAPGRRVPGTNFLNYRHLLALKNAPVDALVEPLLRPAGALYDKLLAPLAISALNTMPDVAAAGPLAAVFAETLQAGGAACLPRYARIGLSESFVDPALEWLRNRGVEFRFGRRVTELNYTEPTVVAVPPWIARLLVPGLAVPMQFEAICNVHFRTTMSPGEAGFWGFVNGLTEWVFARPETVSVTISAANRYLAMPAEEIAAKCWGEISRALGQPAAVPPYRVIWEKRATFACTPANIALRPGTKVQNPNLALAGDWTATGLPATIEGAIRSGNAAAASLLHLQES